MNLPQTQFNKMPENWPLPPFQDDAHLHFLHLGKCAGTSVRLLVQGCFSAEESFQQIAGEHGYLPPRRFKAAWPNQAKGKFSAAHLGSDIFDICTSPLNVFTWLRDPLETSLSILYFITQQVEKRATQAFRRLHPILLERGRWTADAAAFAAFAEGLNDMEFRDDEDSGQRLFWRWTSPGDRATVRLPIEIGRSARLRIEISKITPLPQVEAIRVFMGDVQLPLEPKAPSTESLIFETFLPADLLSEEGADITLVNERPFLPGLGDPRQLGVALAALEWAPLHG